MQHINRHLILLAAVFCLLAGLSSASIAGQTHEETLTAWAEQKGWSQFEYYPWLGFRSDEHGSYDISIVHDRTEQMMQRPAYNKDHRIDYYYYADNRGPITIAGGLPAFREYHKFARFPAPNDPDGALESEHWEYYCHEYLVVVRAQRCTTDNSNGSDPIGILEEYIAFARGGVSKSAPPGTIMGGTTEPTLPPDEPITGIKGEVTDDPVPEKYVIVNKLKGDVIIDYGNFITKKIKAGDHINLGDIVVVDDNSWVHFQDCNDKIDFYIDGYSKFKICKKHIYPLQKNPKIGFHGALWLIIEGGAANIKKTFTRLMIQVGIWDYEKIDYEEDTACIGVHGSIVRVTHNKTSGDKSIAVVEGEAIVMCIRQPEMLLSVKPGEKLTLDKYCTKQKYKLTKSEIQQITRVFPDIKKTKTLTPIADSFVYAYSYSGWNQANFGRYEHLGAGWHPTGGEKRTYVRFDLSDVDLASVGKATLRLYHYHTGGSDTLALGVHRVTSPWTEGEGTYKPATLAQPGEIAWVHQPSFDATPVAQFRPGSEIGKWIEVDVTPLVAGWLAGTPNHGLMIRAVGALTSSVPHSEYGFYAREDEEGRGPVLVLSDASAPVMKLDRAVALLCASDAEFIRSLYHCITHREPTAQELEAQVGRLQGGVLRKEMVTYFFASPGYVNQNHDSVRFITDACQAIYGRQPTEGELAAWPRTWRSNILEKMFKDPAHLAATQNCEAKWRKAPSGDPSHAAAYKAYIAAYSALTTLMAAGKGDTPEAKAAYQKFILSKIAYEKALSGSTPRSPEPGTGNDIPPAADALATSAPAPAAGKTQVPATSARIAAAPVNPVIHATQLLNSIPPSPWNRENVFSRGDTIYMWVESKVLHEPHTLEIVWVDPSGKEVKRETFDLHGWGSGESIWSELKTSQQMMQGQWGIRLLTDGRQERAVSFILNP